jgi:ABC-type sugar transport system ATPase subunit
VLKISDMVTILRDGEVVCCNNTESFTLASLVKYMVGKETDLYPKKGRQYWRHYFAGAKIFQENLYSKMLVLILIKGKSWVYMD